MKTKTKDRLCTAGVLIGALIVLAAGGGYERELATLRQLAPLLVAGVTMCGASLLIGGWCK